MANIFHGLETLSHLTMARVPPGTNVVKEVGEAIYKAMNVPPAFEVGRYDWPQPDSFVKEAKQNVPDGSRQCVIVGGQASTDETVICFRVIERQTPHAVKVLGGLVQAQVTTESDRNGERAARFQAQIKEGAPMVEGRIRRAIGQVPVQQ